MTFRPLSSPSSRGRRNVIAPQPHNASYFSIQRQWARGFPSEDLNAPTSMTRSPLFSYSHSKHDQYGSFDLVDGQQEFSEQNASTCHVDQLTPQFDRLAPSQIHSNPVSTDPRQFQNHVDGNHYRSTYHNQRDEGPQPSSTAVEEASANSYDYHVTTADDYRNNPILSTKQRNVKGVQRAKGSTRRRKTAVKEDPVKTDYKFGAKFDSGAAALAYLDAMIRRVRAGDEDDYATVASSFTEHSKKLFDGLTHPHVSWPANYGQAVRESYETAQVKATRRVTGRLTTLQLCELAEARVAAAVGAVIDIHSQGVPKRILGGSGLDTEEDMTCSERMALVIRAVERNNLVAAEAVINGDFAELVRAPKGFLQRKLDNARGTADKKRKFEVAKTVEGLEIRGKRSKPVLSSSRFEDEPAQVPEFEADTNHGMETEV